MQIPLASPTDVAIKSASAIPLVEMLNAVAYFIATIAVSAHGSDEAMLLWPANAIAIAVLATRPRLNWAMGIMGLAVAGALADFLGTDSAFITSAASTGVNIGTIGLATWLLRGPCHDCLPTPTLTPQRALRLGVLVILCIPALRALPMAVVAHLLFNADVAHGLAHEWLSGAVGACLFTPAIFLFSRAGLQRLVTRPHGRENLALLTGTLLLTYLVIHFVRFPFVVIGLPLTLVAFRVGAFGAACTGTITGMLVILLWYAGVRPHGLDPVGVLSAVSALPFPALAATLLGPLVVGLAIDDRRAAVRRLQSSERQLRESIECSPIGMCLTDMRGVCTVVNAAFTRMLGYTEHEYKALPFGHVVHPSERPNAELQMGRLAHGETDVYTADRRYLHKQGAWIWVHVTVSLARGDDGLPSHYFSQIESIQERRVAEAKLVAERSRLDTTLRSIVDAVITTNESGAVTYANPAAIQLLGQPLAAVETRRLSDILVLTDAHTSKPTPDLLGRCIARLEIMQRSEPCLLHRPDSTICHISETVSPVLDVEGRFAGAVVVIRDATETHQRTRDLNHRATHDPLTDLANRFDFERRANASFQRALHLDRPSVILMIDLDRFKQVNDRGGHAAGDAMLRLVASALRFEVRDSDTVARLGGDEFAILLDGCPPHRAAVLAEKVLRAVQGIRLSWKDVQHSVGASIGVAPVACALHGETAGWLSAADGACYEAKHAGRNQLRFVSVEPTPAASSG